MPVVAEVSALRPATGRMIDLVFALEGDTLPVAYETPLADALRAALPWLADEPSVGMHPIRASRNADGLVLSKRTRLKLRVPETLAGRLGAEMLGLQIDIGGSSLRIGESTPHPVGPYATLKSSLVVIPGTASEIAFMAALARELSELGVVGETICSKAASVGAGASKMTGFGVVIHDLAPKHSLILLEKGIGPARHLGCGLFVHHKLIEGLDAYPE